MILEIAKQIPLGAIGGIAPPILKLFEDLSLPPLQSIPTDVLDEKLLRQVLSVYTLRVYETDHRRYLCSGGFRLFHLLKRKFPSGMDISCLVEKKPKGTTLQHRALAELFVGPAIQGVRREDIPRLLAAFDKAVKLRLVGAPKSLSPLGLFSKVFGVDTRSLSWVLTDSDAQAEEPAAVTHKSNKRPASSKLVDSNAPSLHQSVDSAMTKLKRRSVGAKVPHVLIDGEAVGFFEPIEISPDKETITTWIRLREEAHLLFKNSGKQIIGMHSPDFSSLNLPARNCPRRAIVSRGILHEMIFGALTPKVRKRPALFMHIDDFDSVFSAFEKLLPQNEHDWLELERLKLQTSKIITRLPRGLLDGYRQKAAQLLDAIDENLLGTVMAAVCLDCPIWAMPAESFGPSVTTMHRATQSPSVPRVATE